LCITSRLFVAVHSIALLTFLTLTCITPHSNDMTSWQNSSAAKSSCNVAPFFYHHSVVIDSLVSDILYQTPCIRQGTFFKFKGKRTKCLDKINYVTKSLQNVILHKIMISCNILFYFLTILVMHLGLCTLVMSRCIYREIWCCPHLMHYIKIAGSDFCQIKIINKYICAPLHKLRHMTYVYP